MVNFYDNQTHRSHHDSRKQHSHSDHHDHGDMVNDFRKRFYISLIVTIPILIMSPAIQSFFVVAWQFAGSSYILFGLSTFIFFYVGWLFISGGIDELKDKNPVIMNM